MRNIKALVITLVLGLAGMVYAAGNVQMAAQTQDKAKADACCCCMSDGACPMKSHEHQSDAAAKMDCCEKGKDGQSCDMSKDGQEGKNCCAAMADHAQAGDHQGHEGACCNMHHDGDKSADKQACEMGKDGAQGCCHHEGGGCCKAKTAKL
jgi:hypothetical protein